MGSFETGQALGRQITAGLAPSALLYYATADHDQLALLHGLRSTVPPETRVIGCSTQGVTTRGDVLAEGRAAGALGLAGVEAATAEVAHIDVETRAKGRALGAALRAGLRQPPKVIVLHWDPLCGADMDQLLAGLQQEVRCPVIGGGAGLNPATMETFQAFEVRVFTGGAVAMALSGEFSCELGCSLGGVQRTRSRRVTRDDLLEGTDAMARTLRARLGDRTIRAVLGFEDGARHPVLGPVAAVRENVRLQEALGSAAWLGMLTWGQLSPLDGQAMFLDCTYPLLVLAD